MKDLTERLRKIQDDAVDCPATDQTKRQTFGRLATQLEQTAADLEAVIAAKRASGRNLTA
jgi:GTP1/Obg family GTP-binding protein